MWRPLAPLYETLIPKGVWPLLKRGDTQVVYLGKAQGFPVYVATLIPADEMRQRVEAQGAEAVRGFFSKVLDVDTYKRNPMALPDRVTNDRGSILAEVVKAAKDVQALGFAKMTWPVVIADTSGEYNYNTGATGTGGHMDKGERMLVVSRDNAYGLRSILVHEWAHYFHEKGMSAEQKKAWLAFYVRVMRSHLPTAKTYRHEDWAEIPSREDAMRMGMEKVAGTVVYGQETIDRWYAAHRSGIDQWLTNDHDWMEQAIVIGAVFIGRLKKSMTMVPPDYEPWHSGTSVEVRKGTQVLVRRATLDDMKKGRHRFILPMGPDVNYAFVVAGGKNKGAWSLGDYWSMDRVVLDRAQTLALADNHALVLPPPPEIPELSKARTPFEALSRYCKEDLLYAFERPTQDLVVALSTSNRDSKSLNTSVFGDFVRKEQGLPPSLTYPSTFRTEPGLDVQATYLAALEASLLAEGQPPSMAKAVYAAIFPLVDPQIRVQWTQSSDTLMGPEWEGIRILLQRRGASPSAYGAANDHELFAEVVTCLAGRAESRRLVSPEVRQAFRKVMAGRSDF